jgi:hypothetical protein
MKHVSKDKLGLFSTSAFMSREKVARLVVFSTSFNVARLKVARLNRGVLVANHCVLGLLKF